MSESLLIESAVERELRDLLNRRASNAAFSACEHQSGELGPRHRAECVESVRDMADDVIELRESMLAHGLTP